MPASLTAVVVQTQALFTAGFAAVAIADRSNAQQIVGMSAALAGLSLIGFTLGGSVTLLGFALTLASAASWAIGNVLVKRLPKTDMLNLMVWASLVPPVRALAISAVLDGPASLMHAVAGASWLALGAPFYLGLLAGLLAYAAWVSLLTNIRPTPSLRLLCFRLVSAQLRRCWCRRTFRLAATFRNGVHPARRGDRAFPLHRLRACAQREPMRHHDFMEFAGDIPHYR